MNPRDIIKNPVTDAVRDVVGVESWAARTYADGADNDGVENPDRRDVDGNPPGTFDDVDYADNVGDNAPALGAEFVYPEPSAMVLPLRTTLRQVTAEDTEGGTLLAARDATRYRLGVKVVGDTSAHLAHDEVALFSDANGRHFLLEADDGLVWLHGGAEMWMRGSGATATLYIIEELYAVGTIVHDASNPAKPR